MTVILFLIKRVGNNAVYKLVFVLKSQSNRLNLDLRLHQLEGEYKNRCRLRQVVNGN